ncbi:MAG: hypothetical protein MUO72_02655 [Bacteroidales bacterium]|nr:hypothetical protein [Bacteroidales bacterium]
MNAKHSSFAATYTTAFAKAPAVEESYGGQWAQREKKSGPGQALTEVLTEPAI